MKKLPSLYKNINLTIKNHNHSYCYVREEESIKEENSLLEELLKNPKVYQIPLIIYTKEKIIVTRIIKKVDNKILTIDNQEIPIQDIIKIEK